jgi:hypothetical protein
MKTFVAMAALGFAASVPALASAATQDAQFPLQADTGTQFEIVDQVTGRPVALLVPVAGAPGTLRLIGIARTGAPQLAAPRQPVAQALTPAQMLEQHQREMDEQFHILHDGG